ncbi:MAG TPA: tol-pal system protein YbgF [Geminicoccaceae bacterium]|nr:tol-pal system protein YbgF [Geminicoccaceae bacterium]
MALTLLLVAGGSAAHAVDPGPLRAELHRLTAELAAVRGGVELAQLQEPALRTAALEVRIARLEEELRRLTGRIEEVEYDQRQLAARMDRFVADLDARLPAAAGDLGSVAPPAVAPGQQAAAPPALETPEPPVSGIEPDAAARQGYVLGTIPEDALRGLPAPRTPELPAPTPGAQARLQPQEADAGYQSALDLLQAGRWADAEQAFTTFVQEHPDDARAPNASYWLGETYFFRKDYPTAAAVFARNYRTYGETGPRAPDNLLKLGMALAAMGDRDRACQTFAELAKRHANAPAPIRQALSRERSAAGCN